MSRKVLPFSGEERIRLEKRAVKFLNFIFPDKSKHKKAHVESLAIMLAGEYQRGFAAKNNSHFNVVPQSRLEHLKAALSLKTAGHYVVEGRKRESDL